jgi:Zn-finger nucleic acid-binding protein
VQVDRCPDHGIWFDRGELGRLMRLRATRAETDEGVMLQFLGETLSVAAGDDSQDGRSR